MFINVLYTDMSNFEKKKKRRILFTKKKFLHASEDCFETSISRKYEKNAKL